MVKMGVEEQALEEGACPHEQHALRLDNSDKMAFPPHIFDRYAPSTDLEIKIIINIGDPHPADPKKLFFSNQKTLKRAHPVKIRFRKFKEIL